jgi:O-antigen/teichoic acid export membrane protein
LAILLRSWGPTLLAFILKPVRPAFFFHFVEVASIADFGFSVTAGSLVNIAVFSVPVVFVGKLSGMKELGQAQMAFSLYGNLLFVTAAVVRLNLSAYARLVEHAAEFAATVNQHLQILAAALVPTIVLFAGLAPVWTTLVFGQKWQGLSMLLLAQAPGYLLAAVFWGVLNPALLVSGRHRHLLFWLIGFSVFYALLTRLLTPAWGAIGVAIAFSTTEIVFHPLLFLMYGRICGRIDYRKLFSEIITGVGFMGLFWFCARHSLWLAIVCVVIYLVLWYARNWKILTSARNDFDFTGWRGAGQNAILPPVADQPNLP